MTHIGEATSGYFQENANSTILSTDTDETFWFAVQTKPRHEKRVVCELEEKGIVTFLPLFSDVRQWSDRRREVQLPLFANYVFVRISADKNTRVTVLQTNGVFRFVGARGFGVPIPEEQIQAVQTILRDKVPFVPYPFLCVGQKVRIRGGSLDGLQGVLMALNGDESLIVSVESIQKSIAIRIEGYQLEAA